MTNRLLLLHNGPKPPEIDEAHGDFAKQITNLLEMGGLADAGIQIDVIRTFDPDFKELPDPSPYFAVIMSGSIFDVTQRQPWMLTMEDWIRKFVGKVPMLGICFGHQIIGHALGGETMFNPRGYEVGTYHVQAIEESREEAATDPLVSQLPASFPAVLIHRQSVERLPPGAVAFYRTDTERHQMIRFAPNTYGTQFHPEYTPAFVRDLLPNMSYGNSTPEDFERSAAMVPCPMSQSIVPKFIRLYLAKDAISAAAE